MVKMNMKIKMSIAVSIIVALLMVGLSILIITSFNKRFKENIAAEQYTLISERAAELDETLLQTQKLIVSKAKAFSELADKSPAAIQHELEDSPELLNVFDNGLFCFSQNGRILAETPGPLRRGIDLSWRSYYIDTIKTQKPQISSPYKSSKPHGHPVIMFTAPIFDKEGKITSILGGSVDLMQSNFLGRIASLKIGSTGYTYLFDTNRTMIMHPAQERIMTNAEAPGSNKVFDKSLVGFDGTEENVNSKGLKALTTVKHLKSVNWIVGANYPLADAYAPIRETTIHAIYAVAAGILFTLVMVYYCMRRLTQPLTNLTNLIRSNSEAENVDQDSLLQSNDEIEELSLSFNRMMASINHKHDELQKLSHAIEQSSSLVFITDAKGRLEYANPRLYERTGYSTDELTGKTYHILKSENMSDDEVSGIFKTIISAGEWSGDFEVRKKNGEQFWTISSVSPIRNDRGDITNFVCVQEDISERKQNEEKLNCALKNTDDANRAKSEFLANMSHEIRTPMNGVIGMTTLLMETRLDQTQKEYTDIIYSSGKNLLTLINDILDLSKIEAHRIELESVIFDLHALIDEIITLQTSDNTVSIHRWLDPNVPAMVIGDPLRLRQILINLLSNAAKFSQNSTVHLLVWALPNTLKSTTLQFMICDSGIGIPEDKLEQIFDPFSQGDGSTTRKFGGTGLGLSICKQLVELMGGTISVHSCEGKGSVFQFTVTVGEAAISNSTFDAGLVLSSPSPLYSHINPSEFHLLLAEDDPVNQKVAKAFITKLGYNVDIVPNGIQAIQALEINRYDLVLMDCMMPVMSGFEATAIIRDPASKVKNHHIPVIAMTAKAFSDDRSKCIAAGMSDYLSKPVDVDELKNVIEKWLSISEQSNSDSEVVPVAESAEQDSNNIFDVNTFIKRNMDDRELSRDVAIIFLDNGPEYLQSIRTAIITADAVNLHQHAHKLKGAAANFSLSYLCKTAGKIESFASAGNIDHAADCFPDLERHFAQAADALRRQLIEA